MLLIFITTPTWKVSGHIFHRLAITFADWTFFVDVFADVGEMPPKLGNALHQLQNVG